MESDTKTTFSIAVAVVIIFMIGFWLFSNHAPTRGGVSETTSAMKGSEVAPAFELTAQEKSGKVSQKRADILARVRSKTALTSAEREEIGGIMLAKAHLYQFSEMERQEIFKALSQ